MAEDRFHCANCDRLVGRLERTYDWQGNAVCRECRNRLHAMTPLPPSADAPPPQPAQPREAAPSPKSPAREPVDASAETSEEAPEARETTVWSGCPSQVTRLRTYLIALLICVALWVGALIVKKYVPEKFGPQFIAMGLMALSLLVILLSGWQWILVRHTRYEITSERLRIRTGVFSYALEEIELYRIKDTVLLQPFFLRLFGLGHVLCMTSDKSSPAILIEAVPKARQLRESLRSCIEERRDKKGVREVDFK